MPAECMCPPEHPVAKLGHNRDCDGLNPNQPLAVFYNDRHNRKGHTEMKTSKRMQGQAVPPELRERGLAMVRAKVPTAEICSELGVTDSTVNRWRLTAGVKPPPRRKRGTVKIKAKTKGAVSPMGYLADQLAEVAKMIRAKLPELARFTLTTTADGEANVEYAVRQTTVATGSVKL